MGVRDGRSQLDATVRAFATRLTRSSLDSLSRSSLDSLSAPTSLDRRCSMSVRPIRNRSPCDRRRRRRRRRRRLPERREETRERTRTETTRRLRSLGPSFVFRRSSVVVDSRVTPRPRRHHPRILGVDTVFLNSRDSRRTVTLRPTSCPTDRPRVRPTDLVSDRPRVDKKISFRVQGLEFPELFEDFDSRILIAAMKSRVSMTVHDSRISMYG